MKAVRFGTYNRRGVFHLSAGGPAWETLCGVLSNGLSPCVLNQNYLGHPYVRICKRCEAAK